MLVRAKGLEPPRLASLEPKSSASTNSATPAPARSRPVDIAQAFLHSHDKYAGGDRDFVGSRQAGARHRVQDGLLVEPVGPIKVQQITGLAEMIDAQRLDPPAGRE